MADDWRFRSSPIAKTGLQSYAATQMRVSLQSGKEISLGTLCVASRELREALNDQQKESLVRAADVITSEIAARKRLQRMQEKQSMLEDLSTLRIKARVESVEVEVIERLRSKYRGCLIAIVPIRDDILELASTEQIPLASIHDGLWEDTPFIKEAIESGDFERCIKKRSLRIVAAHITPNERAIIIATSDLMLVFDDLDVWFVEQCAQIINFSAQGRRLREALAAKNTFLRSITHELRTPIHAILSSVELANEEIKSQILSEVASGATLGPFLDTIRRSGTELMTTVNNILRLNGFQADTKPDITNYDLHSLENDALDEIFSNYSDGQMPGLSVRFENKVPAVANVVKVDANLLKELLKCLILNAINAAPSGSVVVTISLLEGEKLVFFDVVDTGVGIAKADHQRIFQAFEKVNPHSAGAGLGLSLASQMASILDGKLSLVFSELGKGSHFQFQLPHIPVKAKGTPVRSWQPKKCHLPSRYHIMGDSSRRSHLTNHLEQHLVRCAFRKSDTPQGSIIVLDQPESFQSDCEFATCGLDGPHAILYISDVSSHVTLQGRARNGFKTHLVFPVTGPLYASRLNEILAEVDLAFAAHLKGLEPQRRRSLEDVSSKISNDSAASTKEATPPATPYEEISTPVILHAQPPAVKALLVDDNKVNLTVLQMYCKKRKIPHGLAIDGNEAVSEFCHDAHNATPGNSSYTIIFMDLQMPECDGLEACRQIRKFEKEHGLPRSVILILTGQDSAADRRDAFEAGVDDFYVKPVSVKKLDQAVAKYFSDSSK